MRPLLLNLAVTLDGYIEGPNGEIDWCLADQDYGMTAFLDRCDALVMGRKSFESMQTYDANAWPEKVKYVFSRTMNSSAGMVRYLTGDLEADVRALKASEGKAIWLFGGAEVIDQCLKAGLVDELCLAIHPVILGGGKPLFGQPPHTSLALVDSVTYDTGLVQLTYAVRR